ncbi:PREDICTED: cytochrome P450 2J2-like, partial [Merops nubicus]
LTEKYGDIFSLQVGSLSFVFISGLRMVKEVLLTEKYGDIFSLQVGSLSFVFISGLRMVKEVLVNQGENFMDRPEIPIHKLLFSNMGLVISNGHLWKQQRRFTLTTLRNFGLGKRGLEERIQEECRCLVEVFGDEQGNPFNPQLKINNAVLKIICSVIFGNQFDYQDEEFQKLLHLMDETIKLHGTIMSQLYNAYPFIMKFLPGSHQTIFKNGRWLRSFVKEKIDKHKEDWNPSESRDFIDSYLQEIAKDTSDSSFQEENLVACVLDLLFAGTETTSTTLRWALLYMALHPEIQARVQAEIDAVIGQGTIVLTNLTSVMFDKNEWETPDSFNPGHFLKDGQFWKREAFMPFSIATFPSMGTPRLRVSAQLVQAGQDTLFLVFTARLQKFTFQAPPGITLSIQPKLDMTLTPQPYRICAVPR